MSEINFVFFTSILNRCNKCIILIFFIDNCILYTCQSPYYEKKLKKVEMKHNLIKQNIHFF